MLVTLKKEILFIFKHTMRNILLCRCSDKWGGYAPLVLRVATGIVFFAHGVMKLTMGVSGVGAFLGMLGFPLSSVFAVILIAIEVVGGLALIAGFMTHWAAKLTGLAMLVALLVVFAPKGLVLGGEGGFVLLLIAASVSLMITGPGKFALDNILLRKMQPGSRPGSTSGL